MEQDTNASKGINNANNNNATRPRKFFVNKSALANMIVDSKRTNDRLDKEEVKLANVKFKKYDGSERSAVLMSSAINNDQQWKDREEYSLEY